ncbi:hypothetical protein RF11_11713 [Thelohanellus kitauei]|uniref:Uncharacterized protein n=1 Tax=Thelohanellus kitauei TaxID=669202 RepID=A0A0C2MZL5_THEKT|nr:hypothetical protein RF11_11713 [Thelohanellus kitauei]
MDINHPNIEAYRKMFLLEIGGRYIRNDQFEMEYHRSKLRHRNFGALKNMENIQKLELFLLNRKVVSNIPSTTMFNTELCCHYQQQNDNCDICYEFAGPFSDTEPYLAHTTMYLKNGRENVYLSLLLLTFQRSGSFLLTSEYSHDRTLTLLMKNIDEMERRIDTSDSVLHYIVIPSKNVITIL